MSVIMILFASIINFIEKIQKFLYVFYEINNSTFSLSSHQIFCADDLRVHTMRFTINFFCICI